MNSPISISNHFKSSARITEANFNHEQFLENFIAHGTVLQTIDSLGAELKGTKQRTFTVTGPYGSGKSTLALFFDCLLASSTDIREQALSKLGVGGVGERFKINFSYTDGWRVVKHLCGLSSPVRAITESIVSSISPSLSLESELSESDCLAVLKQAFDQVKDSSDGVLIIIDEMGKALDYQAGVGGDLHFFQSFADLVQQYDNIIAIGFLHQSFAAYAKGRDSSTQNEWGKVQGRYKDFGFNPSIEESIYLVGESFTVEKDLFSNLLNISSKTIDAVLKDFSLGGKSSFEKVLPIDPLVALLLGPISKQSFSQNERSLFSFIATHEKHGFRDYVNNECSSGLPSKLYGTDRLWDYLYNNLGHVISASSESKAWLEACDAVKRAAVHGSDLHLSIAKLVALFTVMGTRSGLYARKEFLIEYFSNLPGSDYSAVDVVDAIELLEAKSIVIFRHAYGAYHVFSASDLDINRLILDWIERIKGGLDWVTSVSTEKLILANAHYHKTGVMRWAETQVVSSADQVRVPSGKAGNAFVNFVVPTTRELGIKLTALFSENKYVAVAKLQNLDELERASVELIALQKLGKEEADKLSRDPIAKSEIETRESQSKSNIEKVLNETLNKACWIYLGSELRGNSLTSKVSSIADSIYSLCPPVQNELVNRMKLSGTSNSALNKLMLAILFDAEEEDLGLPTETFPPEKGVYLSCLKDKGWHTPDKEISFCGNWFDLEKPDGLPESHQLSFNLWKAGFDFIKNGKELVVVQDLYDFWMSPPFGLTLGLCKLYAMALLKSLEGHLAFYDFDSTKDWIYIPELDEELVSKLWRYPAEAGVRYYELADTDISLVKEIALATENISDESILSTGRSLVKKMHAIPSWVKRTSGHNLFKASGEDHLDPLTKRFRDRVLNAKDPYKLILEDIPAIFGERENLSSKLSSCLSSLLQTDNNLASHFRTTLLDILNASPGPELSKRCGFVAANASRPEIENFAKRIAKWSDDQSPQNLDELISLLVGVRKDSWTDERISDGYEKLRNLSIQFKRYETFADSESRADSETSPVSLIFKDQNGDIVELEQFVDARSLDASELGCTKDILSNGLSDLNSSQRVTVLMALLAKEMIPVASKE